VSLGFLEIRGRDSGIVVETGDVFEKTMLLKVQGFIDDVKNSVSIVT
jgi:hypothetical protein